MLIYRHDMSSVLRYYQCRRHFGSFYRNPTILETVSIAWGQHGESFLLEYNMK